MIMRIFLKSVVFGSILLWMTGCATHQNFVKTYDAWVGQNIHTFVKEAGYPDTTYKLSNGNKVYVYEKTRIHSSPAFASVYGYGNWGYYSSMGYGSDIEYETCKVFLEVNRKGTIVRWGSRGNSCRR